MIKFSKAGKQVVDRSARTVRTEKPCSMKSKQWRVILCEMDPVCFNSLALKVVQ